MLKNQMEKYITSQKDTVELHTEEKQYAERQGLLHGVQTKELEPNARFAEAYIERGNKETEEFLDEESSEFLNQPIGYFKDRKNEFMYLESRWFDLIGVDAVSLEKDDVFGTYDVMLGLKLQKKFESGIKKYLQENLHGEGARYDLMFDANEGIWSLNFALNVLDGYKEDLSIGEAYSLIYGFLFGLAESVENKQ
ncbi:branched-chain amino acid aminotransferase [Mesobacillus boroniphilus]|uniref:Branched-chain amino acid aminotransferase n=1 Tax=Mesobacillus boroniphilus TaxID=308892 RepID=A0A944CL24_9BACI|nr:branched-chain amino acid aminotransferase [Mesobacillus boroniphilus]MBS8264395.1 branched-chain amino acid aminotransferase [Mesobacillus boroniphilus]